MGIIGAVAGGVLPSTYMRPIIRAAAASALSALALTSFAQTRFTTQPGVKELTGQMAVRPWSEVDWMRQGLTAAQARLRVQDAVGRLSAFSPKPVADTGEVQIGRASCRERV